MNVRPGIEVLKDRGRHAETSLNPGAAAPARVRFDRFALDLRRGCLLAGEEEIALRPKTFEFLRYLAGHPGRLVSKDELLAAVWPNVMVTEDSLFQCVAELRRALQDQDQRLIKTVQRRGYRFEAELSAEPCVPAPQLAAPTPPPTASGERGVVVGDDSLTQAAAESRKALCDDARSPSYIETISKYIATILKRKYRLVAP